MSSSVDVRLRPPNTAATASLASRWTRLIALSESGCEALACANLETAGKFARRQALSARALKFGDNQFPMPARDMYPFGVDTQDHSGCLARTPIMRLGGPQLEHLLPMP